MRRARRASAAQANSASARSTGTPRPRGAPSTVGGRTQSGTSFRPARRTSASGSRRSSSIGDAQLLTQSSPHRY
eukprot:scaffold113638_cov36-Phaeocystis_antarctica.AAC.1